MEHVLQGIMAGESPVKGNAAITCAAHVDSEQQLNVQV